MRDASDVRATAAVRNQERLLQAKGEHAAEVGDLQRGASEARSAFEQNAHPTLTLTLTVTKP